MDLHSIIPEKNSTINAGCVLEQRKSWYNEWDIRKRGKRMKILSWLPFGKAAPEMEEGRGNVTGCDLAKLDALARPFAQDPFYRLRPPFSMEAAKLSIELSAAAYTLDLDPWREAGWDDFSILIDDSLQSGLTNEDAFNSRVKLLRAKAALRENNPVSQVLGALRQREKSDTVKAVCMLHAIPGEKYLLAIGFMGTGGRFYDWFSNFRFTPEEGFHRGFYQLCESFESYAEEIAFPALAKKLGLEKLTLSEILSDMRSLSSRFRLWMSGHSQGAAVMQVFTHRLMTRWGVLAQNMVGYGFASPTVATGRFVHDPAAYPLYHILNRDDAVGRIGGLLHLGLCAEYPAEEEFRERVYGLSTDEKTVAAREQLAFFMEGMTDTPAVILHVMALLQCLREEKGPEGLGELVNSWWAIPAVDKVLWRTTDRVMEAISRLTESMRQAHIALTGYAVNETALARVMENLRPVVKETPVRVLISALSDYGVPPHRLYDSENGKGAYAAIVQEGLAQLEPFIWVKVAQSMPVRRYGTWNMEDVWPAGRFGTGTRVKRMTLRPPERRGCARLSYSARRRK